jgi:hypothetical protein
VHDLIQDPKQAEALLPTESATSRKGSTEPEAKIKIEPEDDEEYEPSQHGIGSEEPEARLVLESVRQSPA